MILAIDYGTKKTGFAISDETLQFSIPLKTLFSTKTTTIINHIKSLKLDNQFHSILVGIPSGWQNQDSPQTKIVRTFIEELKANLSVKMIEWDESYSSKIVEKTLTGKQKKNSDSFVAAYLLQEYLDYKNNEKTD